jgi:AraC family transcriptional regulator
MKECPSSVPLGTPRSHSITAGAFLVTDARYAPNSVLPRHHHERAIVAVTLSGRWDSALGSTRLDLGPGDLRVEPPGGAHVNHFGRTGAHVMVMQPDPAAVDLLTPCESLLGSPQQFRIADATRAAWRITRELAAPDGLSRLAIESAALELLAAASREVSGRTGRPAWLPRVIEHMHAHFLENPTIADLSRIGGVHPGHFTREFRRVSRVAPALYLRHLRVEWAAQRLRDTTTSIADISCAAGFADQSHFTRVFSRVMGLSPAAYRRRLL